MLLRPILLVIALFGLTGCLADQVTEEEKANRIDYYADDGPAGIEPIIIAPTQSDVALGLWNSPRFRRDFMDSYKAVTDVEPPVSLEESPVLQEITTAFQADDIPAAIALIEANRTNESSAVFDFLLGNIYFQQASAKDVTQEAEQEYLGKAVKAYNIAIAKFSRYLRAHRNVAMIHVRSNEWRRAMTHLTKVIELGGNDPIVYGLLGYAYTESGNHVAAESAFRLANLLEPGRADWVFGMAQSFAKQGRFNEAVALAEQMVAEDSGKPDRWLLLGNALLGAEKPERAAQAFEMVDQLGKSTVETLNNTADIYVNQGLFRPAVETYLRALVKDESKNISRAIRGAKSMTAQSAYDETESLLRQIEEIAGDKISKVQRIDMLRMRARAAVAQGAGKQQAEILEKIVQLDPLDGDALILLADYHARNEQFSKAEFYFDRAVQIEEFEVNALKTWGNMLARRGPDYYDEALTKLRRAQRIEPNDAVADFIKQLEQIKKARGGAR